MIPNTHESIPGAVGKHPVFHRFESQPPRLRERGESIQKKFRNYSAGTLPNVFLFKTPESDPGAVGKRPVFPRFES